ncbi:MAG: hypothetical protein M3P44_10145 [Actinomycetota bacterium]|nr:hypothetical protein [Actinomycetota bacterium]
MTICAALALPASAAARLPSPPLEAPAASASVQALSAFTWKPVRRAARYELQVSADKAFGSTLLSLKTTNTAGTLLRTLQDGTYYWRVRAVSAADNAGAWSKTRSVVKDWSAAPQLQSPSDATAVNWPATPLALRWSSVPGAGAYLVSVGTDPGLSTLVVGTASKPVETEGTAFALPTTLPAGTYYWAVTPVDGRGFKGQRSRVGSFSWSWPSGTTTSFADLNDASEVVDPQLSWASVPGGARYDLEINPSQDFAVGSKVCCSDTITGTSYSPPKLLPNNTYYWRVRPIDPDGNAGAWTKGQPFTKAFDAVTPSISGLRVEDNLGADVTGGATANPVVRWNAVPGASGYEVRGYPYNGSTCNFGTAAWDDTTEATAWTPLGPGSKPKIGSDAWPAPSRQIGAVARGGSYCVQVRAYTDNDSKGQAVIGAATELRPAFTYSSAPAPSGTAGATQASDYLTPQSGSVSSAMPLFTWRPVPDATGYYAVVARDPDFTKVIDVAWTTVAAYAPRLPSRPISYADETTHYYWAVVPEGTSGVTTLLPGDDSPQLFDKRSVPPSLLAPFGDVPTQPSFRWSPVPGARTYTLQVATDPDFGDVLEDVKTAATAFTTSQTYAADTTLYWRVRANDDLGTGLTWSDPGTFVRRLPAPAIGPNPTAGMTPPLWAWSPVDGAIGYDVHLDQGDGTQADGTTSVAAFSAVTARGIGIIRWKVRARFPGAMSGPIYGGYSAAQSFVRSIPAPAGAKGTRSGARMLLSWSPVEGAKAYKVEVSDSTGFSRISDTAATDLTTWAPDTTRPVYRAGGRIYWRIRATDTRGTLGAAATGSFTLPRSLVVTTAGRLRRGLRGSLTVTVRGVGNRAMRRVGVRVSGAGVARRTKRTGRKGTATFRVRPTRRGSVVVRAAAKGYRAAAVRVAVR